MRSSIVAGAGTLNQGLAIYFNSGTLGSAESRPEPVSVSLPALPPPFDLVWAVKPAAGADFVAEDLKAPARLLPTAPLRAPIEARETRALLELPPLRPLGALVSSQEALEIGQAKQDTGTARFGEALLAVVPGAEPATHTPPG